MGLFGGALSNFTQTLSSGVSQIAGTVLSGATTVLNSTGGAVLASGLATKIAGGTTPAMPPPQPQNGVNDKALAKGGSSDKSGLNLFDFNYYKLNADGTPIVDASGKKSLNWAKIGIHTAFAGVIVFGIGKWQRWW